MIVTPSYRLSDAKDVKALKDFYSDLLSGMDMPGANVIVSPFAAQGDFSITINGVSDQYFDIGNRQVGNIDSGVIAAYKGRSFYQGSLMLLNYTTLGGGGTFSSVNWLTTGPVDRLTNFGYRRRFQAAGAQDNNSNSPEGPAGYLEKFDNVLFSLLRKSLNSVGNSTEMCEWIFNGVRIDY